jgi:naphthalene 1,2-dioxygenase ferredoxin component
VAKWIDVCRFDDIEDAMGIGVNAPTGRIGVYRIGDAVFACDDVCPHGQAFLSDGFLDAFEIECPLHHGRFDIRTGAATCLPVEGSIRTYAVKVVDGRVLVDIDA